MMRRIGFDHVIDYTREDFTRNGRRYDLILDTKTTRTASRYTGSLNPGGERTPPSADRELRRLLRIALVWLVEPARDRARPFDSSCLKQNKDLAYLNQRFEAGELVPVIDGPYPLSEAREAFRHFGAGHHRGKVVISLA